MIHKNIRFIYRLLQKKENAKLMKMQMSLLSVVSRPSKDHVVGLRVLRINSKSHQKREKLRRKRHHQILQTL